jgi:PAS domain S-box-containing protein
VKRTTVSERALILAPRGRDATIAAAMLVEAGMCGEPCADLPGLITQLDAGAAFVIVTEEALATTNLQPLSEWLGAQEEWSDLPFVLLTTHGGGLERNPAAARYLDVLGNVTFLERPFHPTTLISVARAALRARLRQYEARSRLEALRESDRQFRSLANSIPTLCWMAEPDGFITWYNQQWYDYTGTGPADMEGWGWQSVHDRDCLPQVMEKWQRSIETGEPFEMVFPLRAASGEFRSFLTRIQPVRDADGKIVRWFGTNTDVTDQHRAEEELKTLNQELAGRVRAAVGEREAALAQLHEAQKIETLGQLTGGVAHDFNNLLTPITGVLDLLQRRYGNEPRIGRLISGALQSAERARTLVQRLLGFARRQSLQKQAVDLRALLDGMHDLIASSIGASIELRIDAADNLPPALADPNQLELALLNLCVNARDAMPGGGLLAIQVGLEEVPANGGGRLGPGSYLRLSVVDSGTGMDAATLARAIEPFYSTKEVGRGTGLGLSMVHGLAAQLGGEFVLSSAPNEGTRAELVLPVADAAAAGAPLPAARPAAGDGRALAILLVDDEELVRAGTAEMLREMGHQVTQAGGGAEALAKLQAGLAFDLVVSDYMMPRMDGAELAARIGKLRPGLPVLVITGYSGGDLDLKVPHLSKPFRQADLAAAIEAATGLRAWSEELVAQ